MSQFGASNEVLAAEDPTMAINDHHGLVYLARGRRARTSLNKEC
jgi:hypothetical protein